MHLPRELRLPTVMCFICGKHYRKTCIKHKKEKVQSQKELQCLVCDKKFVHTKKRNEHERDHFTNRVCPMEGCNWKITRKSDGWSRVRKCIYTHMRRNHNRQALFFSCSKCEQLFSTENDLHKHHISEHNNSKVYYKCAEFPRVFPSSASRLAHKQAYHSTELLKCDLCSFTCRWAVSLYRHKQTIHGTGKKHQCKVCKQMFTQQCSVRRHMKTAHPDVVM